MLHTRVSEELDEALQDAARRLRLPVSNLVRNVLEDVFDAVEAVTENVGELVEDVVEEAQDFGRRFERRWRSRSDRARERIVEMERDRAPEPRPPSAPSAPPEPTAGVPGRHRLAAGGAEHRARLFRLRARHAQRRPRVSRAWESAARPRRSCASRVSTARARLGRAG